MSYNYSKLKGRIKEKCGTQERFAHEMGISRASLSNKLNNLSEWSQKEIENSVRILNIDKCDLQNYFFCVKS